VTDIGDHRLIERFLRGRDEAAFRELYRRHTPAVYGLICRLARAEADEILQEAWVRAATKLSEFRGESQFRTWLTGIAINCCREWRRRTPHTGPRLEEIEEPSATPDEHSIDVERVLETIPAAFRDVLVLHDIEGMTHHEIAAALDIEAGTSKSRLSRAREMFRRRWRAGLPSEV
jgi:RNA polymerase sigma-70 factor (ECF subfamily)